ncbi:unnamed protein product [Fusarium graminearum]|uniref:Chromosome 1, complete genome n=2 Tax=Gibberella zeae TaxID=5518 RepID=A0A0E0RX45_GIBZE|nr:hypothetical protein FG05_35143 [Fusarium graminearum]CAG1999179.1 unnamed protein product [Fusarium graminearum]CEF75820.1 unnamed protein product [Fusarium graminearum]CZS79100.1 unnamed protein product [Fusarium graminearum]
MLWNYQPNDEAQSIDGQTEEQRLGEEQQRRQKELTVQLGVYAVLGGEPIASSNRDDAVIERGTNTIY